MASIDVALFLTLEGKGTEALAFYQDIFDGKLLFKMTFQEFKTQLAPEHWLSHAVLQIGQTQMQLTDQPIDPSLPCQQGNTLSLSVITDTIEKAQTIYEKLSQHQLSKIYQSPIQNEFADFYAILQDPFGLVIQITKEKTLSDE